MKKPAHVQFLQEHLAAKQLRNPRYSLRAFARQIDLDPSALSRIIAGKQPISVSICLALMKRLQLTEEQTRQFTESVVQEKTQAVQMALTEGANTC